MAHRTRWMSLWDRIGSSSDNKTGFENHLLKFGWPFVTFQQ
jgi:hypothetical protein